MKVDLTDVGGDFDVIPRGKYQAQITDGELREAGEQAKHPGSLYVNWEFTLTEGEFENRKLWTNTSVGHGDECKCGDWKPGSMGNIKSLLFATGLYTKEQLAESIDFEIDDVIGAHVTAIVIIKEYQGDDQNEVKRVKPANAGAPSGSLMP
jgi:hypothetical protein